MCAALYGVCATYVHVWYYVAHGISDGPCRIGTDCNDCGPRLTRYATIWRNGELELYKSACVDPLDAGVFGVGGQAVNCGGASAASRFTALQLHL